MMAILSREETAELFKQRPKEYQGGYIYVPVTGKPQPTPSDKAERTQSKKAREGRHGS